MAIQTMPSKPAQPERNNTNDATILASLFYQVYDSHTIELDKLATFAQIIGKWLGYGDGVEFAKTFMYVLSGQE